MEAHAAQLQVQLDEAREHITQLETLLGTRTPFPVSWNLSEREAELLGLLLNRELVSGDMFMTIVAGARPHDMESDARTYTSQYIHRLRRKGIQISTVWGRGWFIKSSFKTHLRALIEREKTNDQ